MSPGRGVVETVIDFVAHGTDEEVGPACMLLPVPPTIADDEGFREPYCAGYRHAMSDVRENVAEIRRTTNLYFEAHITIAPVDGERTEALRSLGQRYGYRMATFLLKKGSTAVPDDFFTARSTDYDDLLRKTRRCVEHLLQAGIHVKRYKIENTLLDVKFPYDWDEGIAP